MPDVGVAAVVGEKRRRMRMSFACKAELVPVCPVFGYEVRVDRVHGPCPVCADQALQGRVFEGSCCRLRLASDTMAARFVWGGFVENGSGGCRPWNP